MWLRCWLTEASKRVENVKVATVQGAHPSVISDKHNLKYKREKHGDPGCFRGGV